ncbi:MAG: hypothetical protein AB2L14_29870 [Candidatus Xenobiia bacterium LiM19]
MKRLTVLLFSFFIFFIGMKAYASAEDWSIVSGKGVGWIALGERMEKIEDFFGKARDNMGALHWYKDEGLEFYAPGNSVETIIIVKPSFLDRRYSTSRGVRVGSSSEDVRTAFGNTGRALFSRDVYTLDYVEEGITFFIRNDEVFKICLYKGIKRGSDVVENGSNPAGSPPVGSPPPPLRDPGAAR